jgi:hypothetical protein
MKQTSEGSQQTLDPNACSTSAMLTNEDSIRPLDGENVSVVHDDNSIEDKTLCEENSDFIEPVSDGVSKCNESRNSQERNVGVIITNLTSDLKSWFSLPNLTDSNSADGSQERNVNTALQEVPLTSSSAPGICLHLDRLRTGSQTLPSSPAKFMLNLAEISHCPPESLKGKDFETQSGNSAAAKCSKLSPSVLQIDYSSEVHSETPGSATKQRTFVLQKSNRDWRPIPLRNVSKSAIIKKISKLKDDSGTKASQKWSASNCTNAEVSSGSSDTLNLETSKSCDKSQPSVLRVGTELDRPCVRPSDLKLSLHSWDETDGPCTETQASSSVVVGKGKQDEKPRKRKTIIVGSAPEYAGEWLSDETVGHKSGHLQLHKKSFIESGGGGVLPMAIGFFPQPTEGQSLTSFLSSGQFSRSSAELDRENAHFSISEAMIAAIEQVSIYILYFWGLYLLVVFLRFFPLHFPSLLNPNNYFQGS